MKPHPLLLSVLIVNYNGKHLLEACIRSVQQHLTYDHEIIVVDNASHDGSASYIIETFPEVKLIASPVNSGFTGGNNLAARSASGQLLLLLNTDTVVTKSLDALVLKMVAEPACGVLGCRLVYGDGRQQESVGYEPSILRLVLSWLPLGSLLPKWNGMRRTVPSDSDLYSMDLTSVEWVSGACLLTTNRLWMQLGGLDEEFFMYMEDTDYCRRVRESGHSVLYSAACEVTHFEGAARPWIGERAVLLTTDSYITYMQKHHTPTALLAMRFLLSQVFLFRSFANWVSAYLGRRQFGKEKSKAFRLAAVKLLKFSC